MVIEEFIEKIRKQETPFYAFCYNFYKKIRKCRIPIPKAIASFLYYERLLRHKIWHWIKTKLYYEPLLRSRCTSVGKDLKCDGDVPLIKGNGKIIIGDNVFIGNKGAWFVAPNICKEPVLKIGNNTSINYRTVISVESMVKIGNNCHIAEETKIFDNNSHRG
jgi:acetyltransferase-like isoleucine patch superfamily enzyme